MSIEDDRTSITPNWEKYWSGAKDIYFAFCNLYEAVNAIVWHGQLPNCVIAIGCNILSHDLVFFAKYCSDGSSYIDVDIEHIPCRDYDRQKLLEYMFVQLIYASCKIQASHFGSSKDADSIFITKAQLLGYVGNPIRGDAQQGGVANRIITKFISEGFADNFDLRRYCDAYRFMPTSGFVSAAAEWRAMGLNNRFSIDSSMALGETLEPELMKRKLPQQETSKGENVCCGIEIEKFRTLAPQDRLRLMRHHKSLIRKENCSDFNLKDWITLTEIQPSCKDWWPYKSFVRMPSYCWARYILLFPDQAHRCPYDQLRGQDWVLLLRRNPTLVCKCNFNAFSANDWSDLLKEMPEYAKYCNVSKYDGDNRLRIVKVAPSLATEHDIRYFSAWDLYVALHEYPAILDTIDINNLSEEHKQIISKNNPRRIMLEKDPCLIDSIDTSDFTGEDWVKLVKRQPSLFDRINYGVLDEYDWICLMERNLDVRSVCRWEKISGGGWVYILSVLKKPYEKHCDFAKLSAQDWGYLIEKCPEYAMQCPCLDKVSKQARKVVFCKSNFLRKVIKTDDFISADWVEIIDKNPELHSDCNTSSLSERQQLYVEYRTCQYYWHCGYDEQESESAKEKYRQDMNEFLAEQKYFLELERGENSEEVFGWRMWFANEGYAETDAERYNFCEPIECDYYNCVGRVRAYKDTAPEINGCYHRCFMLILSPDKPAPDNIISVEPCDDIYNAIIDEFVESVS